MKKIDKKILIILIATVVLALVAVATAWRFYDLRRQAVSPTAPKLVPAQEPSSLCTVSFTVGVAAGACPVNPICCLQPITTCTDTLQCGSGYICYLGYCVKQTYDDATKTCPAPQPRPPSGSTGGDNGGGGAGGTGGTTPAVSPRPSQSPSPSSSPSVLPSSSPTASPRAGATPSPAQVAQAGPSTSAPSGTSATSKTTAAAASPKSLPEAGISWPTLGVVGGGILFLILGILLAF